MASQPCESGENLVILGPVSTGKTGLAIGAMWEMAIDHDIAGRFVTSPSFLDDLRPRQQVDGMTRRLAKTDRRRVYLILQVLTVDEAMPFVGAVVDAVKRYVTDQDVLSRISAGLTRLADHGLGEHAGDSLLIEISMSPAPACPTSE